MNLILSNLGKDRLMGARQTRWSQKRREEGLCTSCGGPRVSYRSLCDDCMSKQRNRMRSRRVFFSDSKSPVTSIWDNPLPSLKNFFSLVSEPFAAIQNDVTFNDKVHALSRGGLWEEVMGKSPLRRILKRTWRGDFCFSETLECGHQQTHYAPFEWNDGRMVNLTPLEKRRRCAKCAEELKHRTSRDIPLSKGVVPTDISHPRRLRVKDADTDSLMGGRIESGETGVQVSDGAQANNDAVPRKPYTTAGDRVNFLPRLYRDCLRPFLVKKESA